MKWQYVGSIFEVGQLSHLFPTEKLWFPWCRRGAWYRVLLVLFISLLTSVRTFGLPWTASCIPCPTDSSVECPTETGNYLTFQCPSGYYYNDLASLFLNTNDDAIRNLFSTSTSTTKEFRISTPLIFFFGAIYALGIVTYGIAIPSGLFIPVILAGACYGRLAGRLFESISELDTGLFALLGAASFLGGTMRNDGFPLRHTSRAHERSPAPPPHDVSASSLKDRG